MGKTPSEKSRALEKFADNDRLWPADRVERRPVADLVPYARNARTHSPEQVDQIAASIKEWGWTTPVLVDENNEIIAGHGRILAAHKLKLQTVPVMTATGWTEAQKRAYVLADNKLALNADWDLGLLKHELLDLDHHNFELPLTGFSMPEIEQMMFDGNFAPGTADDQSTLDQKKCATCPECGHVFTP